MIRWIAFVLTLICFLLFNSRNNCYAQPKQIQFKHIGSGDGLPDLTVLSITEDKYGFMWFTSYSGVPRYNGYEVKNYNFKSKDNNSLPSNRVLSSCRDSSGTVWFGTEFGICNYNYNTDNFNHYRVDANHKSVLNITRSIIPISDTALALGSTKGIHFFNIKSKAFFKLFDDSLLNQLNHIYINELWKYNDTLFISCNQGLYVLDLKSKILSHFSTNETGLHKICNNRIYSVKVDDHKNLWLLAYNGTVIRIDLNSMIQKVYLDFIDKSKGWAENQGLHCYVDKKNNIWFASRYCGLARYNPTTDSFYFSLNNVMDFNSISGNHTKQIFESKSNILWIATVTGVNYFDPNKNYFEVLSIGTDKDPKLIAGWTRAFAEDNEKKLWIGTVEGISIYDRKTNSFNSLQNNAANQHLLSSNSIRSLYNDDSSMWIGTSASLMNFNYKSRKFKNYNSNSKDSTTINGGFVLTIIKASDGNIYIGNKNGVCLYNRAKDNFIRLLKIENKPKPLIGTIKNIIEDHHKNLWMLSPRNGLYKYSLLSKKMILNQWQTGDSISKNETDVMLSIASNNDSLIWIGTSAGLLKYNTGKHIFEQQHINDDLDNQEIANLKFNGNTNLWFSSKEN